MQKSTSVNKCQHINYLIVSILSLVAFVDRVFAVLGFYFASSKLLSEI